MNYRELADIILENPRFWSQELTVYVLNEDAAHPATAKHFTLTEENILDTDQLYLVI